MHFPYVSNTCLILSPYCLHTLPILFPYGNHTDLIREPYGNDMNFDVYHAPKIENICRFFSQGSPSLGKIKFEGFRARKGFHATSAKEAKGATGRACFF
jgi:hypothetical protein